VAGGEPGCSAQFTNTLAMGCGCGGAPRIDQQGLDYPLVMGGRLTEVRDATGVGGNPSIAQYAVVQQTPSAALRSTLPIQQYPLVSQQPATTIRPGFPWGDGSMRIEATASPCPPDPNYSVKIYDASGAVVKAPSSWGPLPARGKCCCCPPKQQPIPPPTIDQLIR
jgi:hypothetical protein